MGLRPAADGPSVVACTTCRRADDGADHPRAGARLADALRAVRASDPSYAGVAVEGMPCLFACSEGCVVHLRAPGKVGYVMGRFEADEDAARAILNYARAHAASDWGQVPFREWPDGVKGHFIARVPPPGLVAE